jgi:zinc protease
LPTEPEKTEERRVVVQENWPLPVIVVAHHVTFDGHPDSYPLHVASKILSDGQSSRIYRKLVYETGLALSAFGGGNIIEHPSLFFAVAIVQAGQSVDEAERALIAELDRLRNEAVADRELQRAKNQLARDYVIGRESNRQKAHQLAHAAVIHRDAATADSEFDLFMNVAAADVQRAARTYFKPENRLVLRVMPGRAPGEGRR